MVTPEPARLEGPGTLLLRSRAVDPRVLMKTVAHCHARSVTSLVLDVSQGRMIRAFLAWPEHQLWRNYPGSDYFEVGIHDHRYGVSLQLVAGTVLSDIYEPHNNGRLYHHHRFTSGHMRVQTTALRQPERQRLLVTSRVLLTPLWTRMEHNQLHAVWVPEGKPAAWIVCTGLPCKATTNLYTTREVVGTSELYEPFRDRDAVLRHVKEFCNLEF